MGKTKELFRAINNLTTYVRTLFTFDNADNREDEQFKLEKHDSWTGTVGSVMGNSVNVWVYPFFPPENNEVLIENFRYAHLIIQQNVDWFHISEKKTFIVVKG